ncbi:adenylate/guanylate cyclase domain-containing protein [Alteromonadaceae bacterium M269]|nr:adenylate/guanylate cyclase domain-containing protein [Alteromonadaceae bacterium M269]
MIETLVSLYSPILVGIFVLYNVALVVLFRTIKRLKHTQQEALKASKEASKRSQMSAAEQARMVSQTFQKFVPKQFVDHFAKHGLDTLQLGRADEDNVAILFIDIRGFTGLSENMNPQELMNFLNSYFLRMNEPIHKNLGFIDKFIGDAIMALFDHPNGTNQQKAIDSLQAAIDLRTAIDLYNQHRQNSNYPPISVGIGIHFGPVIFGTVGSEDRMDTTVIGDAVNIASRIEALTTHYQADIIVSAQTLETANTAYRYNHRLLDWVRVKGRQQPVKIYEVIQHQDENVQRIKQQTNSLIEQGLEARIEQDWKLAVYNFEQALEINPSDNLTQHHLDVCRKLQKEDMPSDWDGAIDL